ncbi:alpha/beta fold hydrolase, partial [Acidisphaera rubrifaciens]|uniref:alpha/beta fold hydrolase n=1 Tax=Acidisphaera rubrifaciens TaxID=50715 RepID=UPI0006627F78
MATPTPVVFIPALLCDEALYADVIARLGDTIAPHVMMSPLPDLHASAADILARAPARFALVGTSYGGNLALTVALAAPERVSALWIMGANPPAPGAGDPDLAGALAAMPEAVIEQLASLVVAPDATAARATFRAMAARVGAP